MANNHKNKNNHHNGEKELAEDINLLPDELRRREEKDLTRLGKHKKQVEVSFSQPIRDKQTKDKSGKFLNWLFKKPTTTPKKFALPSIDTKQSVNNDLLLKKNNNKKTKKSFWSSLFKTPRVKKDKQVIKMNLLKSKQLNHDREKSLKKQVIKEQKALKQQKKKEKVAIKPIIATQTKIERPRKKGSWWSKLFGTSIMQEKREAEKLALLKAREEIVRRKREITEQVIAAQKNKKQEKIIQQEIKTRKKIIKIDENVDKKISEKKSKQVDIKIDKNKLIEKLSPTLSLNLVPEELMKVKAPNKKQLTVYFVLAGIVAIFIVGLTFLSIVWRQISIEKQLANLNQSLITNKGKIQQYSSTKQEAIQLRERIKHINDLLTTHLYWTKFFDQLEDYTLPDVFFSSFSGSQSSGSIVLSAMAPDFTTIAKQLLVFQEANEFIEKVEINSASLQARTEDSSASVLFNVNLVIKPSVFLNN